MNLDLGGVGGSAGFVGSIVAAFVGTVAPVALRRALSPGRTTV